jgi:MHS family shikimate/dehydroshikimate transporter-like MFS transporter
MMMTTKPAAARSRREYVTAGLASMMGTTIEWYDFFLYGTAAALIFNKIFFPSFDPLTGTLAAFATYSVGFFARPLGGVIFGHYGDKIGRKSMLLITLLLMGVPTILIGLIPSYEQIGYWAAVLLVLMRFLQGIAVGGEWGGAVLMAVEHAPDGKKGFFGSLPQAGVAPGLILSWRWGRSPACPKPTCWPGVGACRSWPAWCCCWWAGSSASRWPSRPTSSR